MLPVSQLAYRIVIVCIFAFSPVGFSADIENEIIYLEADRVDIDEKTGVSTYTGKVKLSRGNITINADKMFAYRGGEKLIKVTAQGAPVYFTKAADKDNKEVKGEALFIDYDVVVKTISLTGDAKLWQEKDQFSGHSIKYDVAQKQVVAQKADSSGDRVRVVIYPKEIEAQNDKNGQKNMQLQSGQNENGLQHVPVEK